MDDLSNDVLVLVALRHVALLDAHAHGVGELVQLALGLHDGVSAPSNAIVIFTVDLA